ncbi:MinD/ParA family protein [Microbacterium testaceum]|uniref:nucleotide-binding protein n=1 Tax=Microbacterium testaceum TaxID=2033 RepID=UPI000A42A731
MTPDRTDANPDENAEHGVLDESGNLDTASITILGGHIAQVSVDLPVTSHDDDIDDDVVEDEVPVDEAEIRMFENIGSPFTLDSGAEAPALTHVPEPQVDPPLSAHDDPHVEHLPTGDIILEPHDEVDGENEGDLEVHDAEIVGEVPTDEPGESVASAPHDEVFVPAFDDERVEPQVILSTDEFDPAPDPRQLVLSTDVFEAEDAGSQPEGEFAPEGAAADDLASDDFVSDDVSVADLAVEDATVEDLADDLADDLAAEDASEEEFVARELAEQELAESEAPEAENSGSTETGHAETADSVPAEREPAGVELAEAESIEAAQADGSHAEDEDDLEPEHLEPEPEHLEPEHSDLDQVEPEQGAREHADAEVVDVEPAGDEFGNGEFEPAESETGEFEPAQSEPDEPATDAPERNEVDVSESDASPTETNAAPKADAAQAVAAGSPEPDDLDAEQASVAAPSAETTPAAAPATGAIPTTGAVPTTTGSVPRTRAERAATGAIGTVPLTRREIHQAGEAARVDRAHAAERVRTPGSDLTLASKRLSSIDDARESPDLLTADRLLDPRQVARPEPEGLWQQLVYSVSGHRINLGDGRRARQRKELDRRIAAPLAGGARFVPVLSRKGGVGKTTVTSLLGMALADARDDRVIAVDANPDRGTLADRVGRPNGRTVRDLVRAHDEVDGYHDVSSIVARDATRLDVLASDSDPRVSEAFSDDDYRQVADVAAHYYSIVLTDTGTGIVHSVMEATLERADSLVVVAGLSVDEARLASETLTWLETNGYADRVRSAIVVLNSARPGTPLVRESELEAHFRTRVQTVIRMPYDPRIAAGSAISFRDLQPETRLAARELAAAVVEGLRAPVAAA